MAGNDALSAELERERKQLAENGSLALAVYQDSENPNTAAGRREKERRNASDRMSTQLAALMADPAYRAAYEALSQTIDDSRTKLDDWNSRIEERLDEINRKLTDDKDLSAAERETLDRERLELLRRQQEIFDLHTLIDDTESKAKRGEFEDKDALDEARKEIEALTKHIEAQMPVQDADQRLDKQAHTADADFAVTEPTF